MSEKPNLSRTDRIDIFIKKSVCSALELVQFQQSGSVNKKIDSAALISKGREPGKGDTE